MKKFLLRETRARYGFQTRFINLMVSIIDLFKICERHFRGAGLYQLAFLTVDAI